MLTTEKELLEDLMSRYTVYNVTELAMKNLYGMLKSQVFGNCLRAYYLTRVCLAHYFNKKDSLSPAEILQMIGVDAGAIKKDIRKYLGVSSGTCEDNITRI